MVADRLKDKVCVITGAGSGIGAQAAKDFAKRGAVVYAFDVSKNGLDSLRDSFNAAIAQEPADGGKLYGEINPVIVNVASRVEVDKAAEDIYKKHGRIDVLVNNAGIVRDATLLKMTSEQFDQVIDVNLKGVFHMAKACAKYMVEKGSGSIINTSSIVGVFGNFGQSNYAAAKSGVIGMTKTWAKELGRKGVRVNAVAPGFIKTEMISSVPEKVIGTMIEKTPLQRLGTPEDISNLYQFLASDDSSYITGQVIGIDGGLVI
jgi:3-oxoacyl-[acyl-carrier protein] reductase